MLDERLAYLLGRVAEDGGLGLDGLNHNGAGTNAAGFAQGDTPYNDSTGADVDVFFYHGGRADEGTRTDLREGTYLGSGIDDGTGVDEDVGAELGPRVDHSTGADERAIAQLSRGCYVGGCMHSCDGLYMTALLKHLGEAAAEADIIDGDEGIAFVADELEVLLVVGGAEDRYLADLGAVQLGVIVEEAVDDHVVAAEDV